MAKKKDNLKDMKEGELEKKLSSTQEVLRGIRFTAEGSKTKNVKEGAALKKQIAQILTKLNQMKASAK